MTTIPHRRFHLSEMDRRLMLACPTMAARCPECGYPLRQDLTACTNNLHRHHRAWPGPVRYATRTGTADNLRALALAGWRLIASPDTVDRYRDPQPPWAYGLDNGAWGCHQRGEAFDEGAFLRMLNTGFLPGQADWLVVPDVVGERDASLELTARWLPQLERAKVCNLLLVAVQDGMTEADVLPWLGPRVGIFVGGTTEWKLRTVGDWIATARRSGCHVHVGRVNTRRRIRAVAGADSWDGTSASRFSVNAAPLAHAAAAEDAQGWLGWAS